MAVTNKRKQFTDPNSYTYFQLDERIQLNSLPFPLSPMKTISGKKIEGLDYYTEAASSQRNYNTWNNNLNDKYPDIYDIKQRVNRLAAAAAIL